MATQLQIEMLKAIAIGVYSNVSGKNPNSLDDVAPFG